MINIAFVFSLRSLPQLVEYGYSLIFFMMWACLCFFIPAALVSAELSSGWPKKGGIFLWVREAFGPKWALIAICMQWATNLPWFSTILAFMASTLAYVISPTLASNKVFVLVVIWIALWSATIINMGSIRVSSFFSSSGVILGMIIPTGILITLGIIYVTSKKTLAIPFSTETLLPKLNEPAQLMFFVGVLMSITGIEISSVHIKEVQNPKKNFVKAIFIACFIIVFLYTAGALAITIVVPKASLNLNTGIIQAFESLCNIHSIKILLPLFAILISYGAFATVVTLMIGPSKGVVEAAEQGHFPKFMQKKNKHGMPVGVLLIQTIISTILSLVIIFMPSVSSAFWIMTALSAQLYFIMYLLMFAAIIKLRYSKPNIKRPYKIPGEKIGIWIIAGVAFLTVILAILFGFIPVDAVRQKGTSAIILYIAFLLAGIIIFTGTPFILYTKSKK